MKNLFLTVFVLFSTLTHAADQDLDLLKDLVNTNSGSSNLKGVQSIQLKYKELLEELGFTAVLTPNPDGEKVSAPLLTAELAGETKETITFILHADTVFEPSSPFQKWQMKDENLLVGPGSMDDKGGFIVLLKTMRIITTQKKKYKYSLRVIISPNEEVGSIGWSETFHELAKKSWLVLGLEPGHDDGGIVVGRKGNVWYEINVKGKESHAGRDHKEGINACEILAQKITQLDKVTDYKKNITASIGHISGGQDKYNIVCGSAQAKLDVRVPSLAALKSTKKKIEAILNHPQVSFKITDETPPFSETKISGPVIKKYLASVKEIEKRSVKTHVSGGVGDSNHFSREGIIILDGLGPIGGHAHTEEEFIDIRTIETRTQVLTAFLNSLN